MLSKETLIGFIAVVLWGSSLPIARFLEDNFGLMTTIGLVYAIAGVATFLYNSRSEETRLRREVFNSPFLYGRWIFFVMHETLLLTGIGLVQAHHVPFVILLNYLWPTFIILCSVIIAGVRITRWWAIVCGSAIVICSISFEVMGGQGINSELFQNSIDRIAYLMVLIGSLSWGLYCALTKRGGNESGRGSVVPLFQLTLALALPLSLIIPHRQPATASAAIVVLLIVYSLLQFVAYLCWDYGMRRGNVVALSLFADFIPWISLFTASVLLHAQIGFTTMVSVVALVCGAMITRYGTLPKKVIALTPAEPPLVG